MKRTIALFLIFVNIALQAGWNEDFDEQTIRLQEALPDLQNADYQDNCNFFKKVRSKLLQDPKLVQQIRDWPPEQKLRVVRDDLGIIVKKRRNNAINDLFVWELSYVTKCNDYISPSFPIEIGGKLVILQKLEDFEIGKRVFGHEKKITNKVSLTTYWKALLQAYILGICDLVGPNIGITKKGIIRFFDNEASLIYYNTARRNEKTFSIAFFCQAIDWPQYLVPMNKKIASTVQNYVSSFCDTLEENLTIYFSLRNLSLTTEGLKVRIEKLKTFEFNEGKTFADFHEFLYPHMSPGLDKLSWIVSKILKVRVGHGVSIFFAARLFKEYNLTPEQMDSLQKWIDEYIID